MMKTYKSIISCMAAAALLCCTACTDKWDEHYADEPGVNGSPTQTLWQLIEANNDLKYFAEICDAVPFRTTEYNKPQGYTFANLLGKPLADGTVANVALTVYAPSLSEEQRDSILLIIQSAENDSVRAKREWQVQTQFLCNHARRNRHDISGKDSKLVYMLNSKAYNVNDAESSINGVEITTANIAATNGVLHLIGEQVPFQPNLHEYLRAITGENAFADLIVKGDTAIFLPGSSIEGEPDEYGRPTYIDSVFFNTNKYFSHSYTLTDNRTFSGISFNSLGLNIAEEDSMYAMIIPSSEAYQKAIEKYKKYYRYSDYYENSASLNSINRESEAKNIGPTRALTSAEDESLMPEYLAQLQSLRAHGSLMQQLTFNINMQYRYPRGNGKQNEIIDAFDAWKENNMVDTIGLLTIHGDTLRTLPYLPYYRKMQYDEEGNVYGINWKQLLSTADESKPFDPRNIFKNQAPVRMSNGLAYVLDDFDVDTRLTVHKDFIVEAENTYNIFQSGIEGGHGGEVVRGNYVNDSILNVRGRLSNGFLAFMGPKASGNKSRTVTFKLPNVLSAKYDIYIVTVPDYYQNGVKLDYNDGKPYKSAFTATLNYVDENYNDTKQLAHKSTQQIAVDSSRVQTVLLFEDFEFPCSYAGLYNCYPTLTITTQAGKSGKRAEDTNNLCIDMIYLKAKD